MVLLQLFRTPRYSLKSSKCNSCYLMMGVDSISILLWVDFQALMKNCYCLVFWKWKTNGFLILCCPGNLESGGKGEKNPKKSTTIALQSPFPEYNGRFEIGLGQSMVIYVYRFIFSKFLFGNCYSSNHFLEFLQCWFVNWFLCKGKKTDHISFQLAPSNYSCADQCYGMLTTYGMRSMVWFICFEKTVFYLVAL